MQRKNKFLAAFLVLIMVISIGGLSALVINQQAQLNAGEDYTKILEERLTEYESVDATENGGFFATVYWFVQREGSYGFTFVYAGQNVITNAGRTALRGHIGDAPILRWNQTAIGDGSGGDATSTTLVNELFREEGTYATVSTYNFTVTYIWTAGTFAGEVITEAGIFNAVAGPTLLSYQDFSGITLQSGDSLQVQFMFQVGS